MFKDENRHYSLRKLSVSLASILIGISFASITSNSVKADTVNSGSNGVQTVKVNDTVAKDSNTAVQGSDVAGNKALKANNSNVTSEDNSTKNNSTKNNSLTNKNDALKAKAEATNKATTTMLHVDSSETTLNLKDINTINPKTLNENKAAVKTDPANGVDPVKFAANGGFDPAIWGTMDINAWQLDNNGNIIGYNTNNSYYTDYNFHIIIPNSADFAKAGKNYQQISISSDEMKKLFENNNAYFGPTHSATLAISLTDNKKVKATNADWSSVFAAAILRQANLEGLDTSTITDMGGMFNYNYGLTSLDLSNWNTSNVTNMSGMFAANTNLTSLDLSNWNTSKVTDMSSMFGGDSGLTNLDVSKWNTSKVTDMSSMFGGDENLKSLDVSNWDTSKVTDMSFMFNNASSLTNLDVSKWKTGNVTNMSFMFNNDSGLTSLDVSKWDTGNVTNMSYMFNDTSGLALLVNGDKFADYLVKNNFADSKINSDVKSVATDNAKLLQLLTNDSQHDSATRTITFTFPANYSPDLAKYHLTKNGSTYQIKQSIDYAKSYLQGTVLINATGDITKHHIDTTKKNKLSDTWQPDYDKLVLAHKNADDTVSFDAIRLPKVPGYKASVKKIPSPANPARARFVVSFMALSKPIAPAINDVKPTATVTPAKPIKAEAKVTVAHKVIDLSNDVVATTPDVSTWHVANGRYTVELPHISNTQLHVIANDSTKDSILFTYKRQHTKYVFNIKFVNGHYLLTTYKIKSGKLVKLIDYNFIKSSKMIDVIVDWIKLK